MGKNDNYTPLTNAESIKKLYDQVKKSNSERDPKNQSHKAINFLNLIIIRIMNDDEFQFSFPLIPGMMLEDQRDQTAVINGVQKLLKNHAPEYSFQKTTLGGTKFMIYQTRSPGP